MNPFSLPAMQPEQVEPQFTLGFPKEACLAPIVWEANGKSPGNTPAAKLQAAQLLIGVGMNSPESGIDIYEVAKVLVQDGPLANATGVQKSREQMQQEAMQAAAAQQAQQQQAFDEQLALKSAQSSKSPNSLAEQGGGGIPGMAQNGASDPSQEMFGNGPPQGPF